MPTTVAAAFAAAGLSPTGVVRWGTVPTTSSPGLYIVSLAESTAACSTLATAPLANAPFERLLSLRPELTLDGTQPTAQALQERVASFWLENETILYIGKATSLSRRVKQYYQTPLGARSPHAGGYFLKFLANLDHLWVHYASCLDPSGAEDRALHRFVTHVSSGVKDKLFDSAHPFPFANLEWPAGTRKAHGVRGAREPRFKAELALPPAEATQPPDLAATPLTISNRTQRVTAKDLASGRIRIPASNSAPTKALFPSSKAQMTVALRGRLVQAKWDPRLGPDRERSGVLRVGSTLRELVDENEVLSVLMQGEGVTTIT